MDHRSHIKSLDGLRGLAFLLVFFYHFYPRNSADPISMFVGLGWLGVDLFFVLSGFLITGILYDTLEQPRYFSTFYIRRVLRLLPVYVVWVAVVISAALVLSYRMSWWTFPFLLWGANILIATNKMNGIGAIHLIHLWSLAVEEQFYLLWPLAVWLLRTRRRIFTGCMVGWLTSFSLRWWSTGQHPGSPNFVDYYFLQTHLDGLLLGAALAVVVRSSSCAFWMNPILLRCAAAMSGISVLLCAFWDHSSSNFGFAMVRFGYSAAAFGFTALIALALRPGSWVSGFGSLPAMRMVGRYSYCLYLIHLPPESLVNRMISLIDRACSNAALAHLASIAAILAYLGLCLGVARLSYEMIERRFLRLKDRFAYSDEGRKAQAVKPSI